MFHAYFSQYCVTSVRHPFKKALYLGIRVPQLFTFLYRMVVLWSLLLILPHKAQFLNCAQGRVGPTCVCALAFDSLEC